MAQYSLKMIEHNCYVRISELRTLSQRGDPWVFECASTFIENLAQLRLGKETDQNDYKDFLKHFFFKVRPAYATFQYDSGKSDLDVQLYHVLRCGLVHNYSLIAGRIARTKGGRDRSILLAHRANGYTNLSSRVNNHRKPKIDAAVLTAEDFIDDIELVTKELFRQARIRDSNGKQLRQNIKKWFTAHPPIGVLLL